MRVLKKILWPYRITISDKKLDIYDLIVWCKINVGEQYKSWHCFVYKESDIQFSFKEESDLLVFKLKWGNYGIKKSY